MSISIHALLFESEQHPARPLLAALHHPRDPIITDAQVM